MVVNRFQLLHHFDLIPTFKHMIGHKNSDSFVGSPRSKCNCERYVLSLKDNHLGGSIDTKSEQENASNSSQSICK